MSDRTEHGSYGQFCPVAMAAEIVCSRWTALVLREMLCGTTRFNDLRRGVPRMSPTLLSKRLKELEEAGVIVDACRRGQPGVVEYRLTEAGEDLRAVVMSLGIWGQRWVEVVAVAQEPRSVAADVGHAAQSRPAAAAAAPHARSSSMYPELSAAEQSWWLVVDDGKVDLCGVDPGFEVDLYVRGLAAQHDRGLDGHHDAESRNRGRQDRADRRQGMCAARCRSGWA